MFVISKDMGKGNPPAFFAGAYTWSTLEHAKQYPSEASAQAAVDCSDFLAGCIVMPNDETVFVGRSQKNVEVVNGMKPDTGRND
ncbi:MAG TPA: hypothetical protein VHW09_26735 [Bryobacteraceae bacterium]|jgi:hypothetical protein|nr:hypothetical protein [Bryobacteraceae bacterium]